MIERLFLISSKAIPIINKELITQPGDINSNNDLVKAKENALKEHGLFINNDNDGKFQIYDNFRREWQNINEIEDVLSEKLGFHFSYADYIGNTAQLVEIRHLLYKGFGKVKWISDCMVVKEHIKGNSGRIFSRIGGWETYTNPRRITIFSHNYIRKIKEI